MQGAWMNRQGWEALRGHRGVAQRRVREQGSLRPPERGG